MSYHRVSMADAISEEIPADMPLSGPMKDLARERAELAFSQRQRMSGSEGLTGKLTPRQNELISMALSRLAGEHVQSEKFPELAKSLREILVKEMSAVTEQTDCSTVPDARSICG